MKNHANMRNKLIFIKFDGIKCLDFRQKKVSEIRIMVLGFWTLFYLHTSDNLLPCTETKCGTVKTKPKKPVTIHLEANGTNWNVQISDTV